MRLPEHLELLVSDEPVLDLYSYGPWRVPDGLYDQVRDRLRALAADPRAAAATSDGGHPLLAPPGLLVLGDLLLALDFLCGAAAINSGSHSRLQFQFFNEYLREPQEALRPPGGWGVTTGAFRPLEWLEDAPDQATALSLARASLDVLEGVEPLEPRRRALIALYDDPPPALDITRSLEEQRRVWMEHASDEIVAVLPELAGPIGYLEWICAGLLPLHRHLVEVAPHDETVPELMVHLLAQAGLTQVPAELSAVLGADDYQEVLERFAKTQPVFDANQWYINARAWLARALGAGEADACRGWLDMAMRFTGAVQGFPEDARYPDPEWIPVGEFQADLRRLATPRRRVVNPLAATVGQGAPRTRRPRKTEFHSGLVGQPDLVAALTEIAEHPERPVRLMIVGPDGTGKRDAAQEIARLLEDRQITDETLWLADDFFAGKEVSAATTHLYNDARESAGTRLMVIDGLDDMARDPRSGEAIVEELHRALDVRDDLHVVALCEPGGDERVREVNPGLSLRFQVVRTRPFTPEAYAELFARALYQRGARAHKHALTAAGRLLAQTPPVRNLRNARLAQRLADVIVDTVRERTPAGDELVVKRADVPAAFDPSGSPKDPLAELDALVGLRTVKQEIELVTAGLKAARLRREAGLTVRLPARHMVFTGNPGTGKTVVARLLARVYKDLGVLSSGHLVEVGRADLIGQYLGETAVKTRAVVQRAVGGVLFIDEAYSLAAEGGEDYGAEAVAELVKMMEDHRDDLVVIAAGYEADMQRFITANPGLASRFPTTVRFPDFSDAELVDIFAGMAGQAGLEADDDARARVAELLRRAPRGRSFGNARLMRNLCERATALQARRVTAKKRPTPEELGALTAADIPGTLAGTTGDVPAADPLAALDALVGLREVKQEVHRLVAEARSAELRRAAGQPAPSPTRHLVLTGNPGTAKTTVARLVAAVYARLGLLSSGHLVEVHRADLVGGYLGQTAPKVRAAVERAVGGVLFIDEAYALGADAYGQEAVATLVKLMEEYRGDLVVMAAGYDREMTAFLAGNSGLESRFARRLAFPDYTDAELVEIFTHLAAAEGFTLAPDVPDALHALLRRTPRGPSFGNGRLMRNVLDMAIGTQAQRLLAGDPPSSEEVVLLRATDIPPDTGTKTQKFGLYL
ncbi:AAA family ATPase [Actinomadura macrotermitis]|uniref:Holliday junction ATP-dependent DNA helicase RuvB n=1 Tax=Actinomadura macrotermitis TaxID=2585200 RepID=A0A7K0BT09_9ACTN|nr:AAA family ATPase [Actinomadura macrotermitis]MQY04176.1 Holliday junction ATP-dependent DNA helicase RuvB [Actinomadura macrotermitis]